MHEKEYVQLPRTFRIFLTLEKEASEENPDDPRLLSRNIRSEHSVNEEVPDER